MNVRNFRFLFENSVDGMVASGSLQDDFENYNYLYACGREESREEWEKKDFSLHGEISKNSCHIFILASFSIYYIKKLLEILREVPPETVILPYLTPIQRFMIFHRFAAHYEKEKELQKFVECPYKYLKRAGVTYIILLFENGDDPGREISKIEPGYYFEDISDFQWQQIQNMEGHYTPVVKAGYLIENGCLFCFGCYGKDEALHEDTFPLIFAYRGIYYPYERASHEKNANSIAMLVLPLAAIQKDAEGFVTGRTFPKERGCDPFLDRDEKNCLYNCIYHHDHSVFREHKGRGGDVCIGLILLGNVDLQQCFDSINERFGRWMKWVRAVGLPMQCNKEYWNSQCLSWFEGGADETYWLVKNSENLSPEDLGEIAKFCPKSRTVLIDKEYGYCFAGYLVETCDENLF